MDKRHGARHTLKRFPVIAKLTATLISVVVLVSSVAVGVLYDAGLKDKKQSLIALASDAAALIDTAVSIEARDETYNPRNEQEFSAVTIARDTFGELRGIGHSGSVLIAQRQGPDILVLFQQDFSEQAGKKNNGESENVVIDANAGLAKAIIAALHGKTGSILLKHNDSQVITAFAPIRSQGLAFVAMAQRQEFNAPFVAAIMNSLLFGIVLTAIGVYILYRQTVPVVERVQESENRFQGFADTATEWFWETGPNLRFRVMGKGGRMDGVDDRNRYLGLTRHDLTTEDTSTQKWRDHQEDMLQRRPFLNFQYEANLGGEIRTLSVTGLPFFDEKGEFKGYQGTGRDITDLTTHKHRIEEAEERLRRAFESITMSVIVIDEFGKIESFNPHSEKVFGYDKSEVIGKNISILMPEPDRGQHDQYIRNYVRGGQPAIIGIGREVTGLRKNGELFPMHLGVGEMLLRGERHFVGSINDLSDAKALEQQLRRSQKMDAIGQLTGGIAHDFNNLLGIIIGNLDLMRSKLDEDDKNFQRIDRSIRAAARGAKLTSRLLSFSRQTPDANDPVDVNQTLRDLRDLVQRSITAEIEIELILDDNAGPAHINKSDFEDALINLSINAHDAMPNGGILTIETKRSRIDEHSTGTVLQVPTGDYLEVAVSDNGTGMTHEVINHIFEPFYTTKTDGKGTGLGMAMVYGFVKRSRGTISIYSELGVGTTIKLYLPYAPQHATGNIADATVDERIIRGGNETILIVDDELDLAEIAATILGELGYECIVVFDAPAALSVLSNRRDIDLLMSDVIMPGMNGFELAGLATERMPSLKVLMTSGYTGNTSMKSISAGKNYPLLRKPYSNRDVAIEVRKALDASDFRES